MDDRDLREILERVGALEAEVRDLRTQEVHGDNVIIPAYLRLESGGDLVLNAAGQIVPTSSRHGVDTFAAAAADDLDWIIGGVDGDILVIKAAFPARTVTVRDAAGNIQLAGANFPLDSWYDVIVLQYQSGLWVELTRSNNA